MLVNDQKVVELYTIKRLSIQQISEHLDISTYRIQRTLKKNGIAKRTISEAITACYITRFGMKEFVIKQELTHHDELLKVAGIMLYWGEGSKRGNAVGLSNSNPDLIKLFLHFLRTICGVAEDRIRISIHYYEDLDPEELVLFWSRVTKVHRSQFYKPWLHVRKKGTYRSPSLYGTILVTYSDKKLLKLILQWIEEYKEL